ncbi:MAG: hypothetical protein ACRD4X_08990 [Candidatus Acidiferrales bacterium]
MPFIDGKFYMNPALGRAIEQARAAGSGKVWPEIPVGTRESFAGRAYNGEIVPGSPINAEGDDNHWVTIDHQHVLIHESQHGRAQQQPKAPQLLDRDRSYLDKYYDAVSRDAKKYKVDPALVLGLGIESGFASKGTYRQTGDAFGMTGGSTKHMTRAGSPAQDVQKFFDDWGNQVRGTGSNVGAFIDGLQGRDPRGDPVHGWKV